MIVSILNGKNSPLVFSVLLIVCVVVGMLVSTVSPTVIVMISAAVLGLYVLGASPVLLLSSYYAGIILLSSSFPYIRIGPFYITEVIIFSFICYILFTGHYRKIFVLLRANRPIVFFFSAFILSGILSLIRGYHNGLWAGRDSATVFYCVMVFLTVTIIKSKKELKSLLGSLLLIGILLDILIFLRMFTQGFGNSEMGTPRLFGARTSAFLFLTGTLALSGVFANKVFTKRMLSIFGVGQFCILILLSGTRNVWIAAVVSFLFWLIFIKRAVIVPRTFLVYLVVLFVLALGILGISRTRYTGGSFERSYVRAAQSIIHYQGSGNATSRIRWWKEGVRATLTYNPILGRPVGSMTLFARYDPKYDTYLKMAFHNSYMTIFYYTGLLGLSSFLLLLTYFLKLGVQLSHNKRSTTIGNLSASLTTAFIFYITVAFFNVILEGPQSATFFWLLPGLLFVLQRILAESSSVYRSQSEDGKDIRLDDSNL